MQHGVGLASRVAQKLYRFDGPHDLHLDTPAFGLLEHIRHHRQSAVSACADHQPAALPGNLLLDRKRRVAELASEPFCWFLLAQTHRTPIDDDVLLIGFAVDADGPEREPVDAHDLRLYGLANRWMQPPHLETQNRSVAKESAGLLLYRRRDGTLEVLLVHPGGPFW